MTSGVTVLSSLLEVKGNLMDLTDPEDWRRNDETECDDDERDRDHGNEWHRSA